ncbi:MAG: hypothetical protein CL853_09810 [Crocinitomicaceae bacterium]|nr:hypothetical protein [Crocinitomicaceae bacterium]
MKRNILFLIFSILSLVVFSQNINYQLRISELMATADNNDGGGFGGAQDPTWFIWIMDDGTNASAVSSWQATGCISTTNTYNVWWTGNPSNGPNIPYNWLTINNSNATSILTEMEGFEDDCGQRCTYETSCGTFGLFDDDNRDSRASSGNINILADPPCSWNQYTIQNGDYFARIEIYWEYVSIDPGSITGDQSICPSNGDPQILNSVNPGSPATLSWATYQWQESIGCTGSFVDIFGATAADYDPPAGVTQNTCYRRVVTTNCSSLASNEITVSLNTLSTNPSSIIPNPTSICGSGQLDLSVNGGSLGTGAQWVWYNGDPNAGGTIIGTGNPLSSINISSTTDFYVRAEGNCDSSSTINQLVIVETPSTAPSSLTSSQTTICEGDAIDLTANGASLGTNALYAWYDSNPTTNPSTPIFTSTTNIFSGLTPTSSSTYYVRLEGCDTTAAVSVAITVETLSQEATTITATNNTVCSGSPTTLTLSGGILGSGAIWTWYEGGCGAGTAIGNGTQITVNPITQTTYFARAEGTCNTTNCISITINTQDLSSAPTAIIPSLNTICPGDISLLSVSGGSLGANATWQWYANSCGTNSIGSGSTITVSPSTSTTYYVRAEGTCNTTACADITITVNDLSTDPTTITPSASTVCSGSSVNLSVSGGILGTNATYEWYTGSCGGNYVGSGNPISVSPTTSTNYFVRAEGSCNTTNCVNQTITVDPVSTTPLLINASSNTICPGSSSTLAVSGGFLAPNDTYFWYENSCGATNAIGSGNQITVSPLANTTYYVRAEGPCGNTTCIDITISLSTTSVAPTAIVASNTSICAGQSSVLSVSGGSLGSGATWQWYSNTCGGTGLGSGNSISVSPTTTTTYYVRAEGTCGNTTCESITITVGAGVSPPTSAQCTNNNICPGETTDISVIGPTLPAGYTYVWYTGACGAVPFGVGTNLQVSPTTTTTYYVNAVGTCGATSCEQVTVTVQNGSIPATGITSSSNNFCSGESTTLTVDGGLLSSGANWTWYQNSCGGTLLGTGNSISVTPQSSTSYYVRAEGGVCGNTNCESIFISTQDVVVHMNPFDTICGTGFPFILENGEPIGGTYSGPGVNNNTFYPSIAGTGTHTITYEYTSANGCTGSSSRDIVIIESTLNGSIVIDQLPCGEGGVTLYANVSGGEGFLYFYWNDGEIENPRNYVQEGIYSVMIQDSKDCILELPSVEVTEEMDCFEIPNTFTPNSDGKNDTWNLDFSNYTNLKIEIFSRWGNLVWESTDLIINWDGNSLSGKALPSNTYYYILSLNNGEKTQNGPVILLR